jgi:allantoinase
MRVQAHKPPVMVNLSPHPNLMHALGLRHLRRVFAHLAGLGEQVWLARSGEIAVPAERALGAAG